MAPKVYPAQIPSSTCSSYMTTKRETFTIWMKSLVFHGNGCTVFDSNGEIVYRIDNYDTKCCDEVHLMNLRGKVLCSIRHKKLRLCGCWDGYKWSDTNINKERPWFRVKKYRKILSRDITCHVFLGCDKASCYRITGLSGKSGFKITEAGDGTLVAEVKQKQSSTGVLLGDDVLTLVVEPEVDHSLIVALVTVYGLMKHKL